MIVLGIDPGIAIVGFSVLEYKKNNFKILSCGSIKTKSDLDLSSRLEIIHNEINEVIESYNIDSVAIEELFFNKNVKTAIDVAQARGVLILTCKLKGLPIYEYTPLQVKQGVVGYGRARKSQVQEMVKIILCLDEVPKPDDVADAMAIAISHCHNLNHYNLFKV